MYQAILTYIKHSTKRKRYRVVDRDVGIDAADLEERRYDAPGPLRAHPRAVGDRDRVVGLAEADPDLVFESEAGSLEVEELVAKHGVVARVRLHLTYSGR